MHKKDKEFFKILLQFSDSNPMKIEICHYLDDRNNPKIEWSNPETWSCDSHVQPPGLMWITRLDLSLRIFSFLLDHFRI